ncbi:MAG: pantoate--beta-alanine ligase [Nitrospiraceae bacterium]|nr:pantoate--beta-alanine ligase [Nitrospiraceae bacterium]
MEIIRTPRIMQQTSEGHRLRSRTIGFVPTMGALHEGHISLIKRSKSENDITVVSIFVNPTQFGLNEDFDKYPKETDSDIQKLEEAGVDTLFMPDASNMYPDGFSSSITVGGLDSKLCGEFRPGHFSGVATVVCKLLNITRPARAYFGQKDFQQSVIIKRMAADLNIDCQIVVCPTIREGDGLAKSSRNSYLSAEQRAAALVIYRALNTGAEMIRAGEKDAGAVKKQMNDMLAAEPLVSEVQYASVYDPATLDELAEVKRETLLAVALRIGSTRLIDNMLVSL